MNWYTIEPTVVQLLHSFLSIFLIAKLMSNVCVHGEEGGGRKGMNMQGQQVLVHVSVLNHVYLQTTRAAALKVYYLMNTCRVIIE